MSDVSGRVESDIQTAKSTSHSECNNPYCDVSLEPGECKVRPQWTELWVCQSCSRRFHKDKPKWLDELQRRNRP